MLVSFLQVVRQDFGFAGPASKKHGHDLSHLDICNAAQSVAKWQAREQEQKTKPDKDER